MKVLKQTYGNVILLFFGHKGWIRKPYRQYSSNKKPCLIILPCFTLRQRRNKKKDIPLKYLLLPFVVLWILFSATFGLWVFFGSVLLTVVYLLRKRISHLIRRSLASKYDQHPQLVQHTDAVVNRVDTSDEVSESYFPDDSGNNPSNLLNLVKGAIEEFRPSTRYDNEEGYHAELVGYLKSKFRSLKMEEQVGSSRPDIIIQNIAIEVKGPTGNKALDSLTTKCLKYLQHYPHLIVVLFEPFFNEGHFREISKGLEMKFPNLIMVRKPNYFTYQPSLQQKSYREWRH